MDETTLPYQLFGRISEPSTVVNWHQKRNDPSMLDGRVNHQ